MSLPYKESTSPTEDDKLSTSTSTSEGEREPKSPPSLPASPGELHARPASPPALDVAPQLDIKGRRPIALGGKEEVILLASLMFCFFLTGWNDGSIGPLLLPIQAHYHTTLSLVSLSFILNLVGFLLAALSTVYLTDRLGFGKTITLGAAVQVVAYAFQCWAPPFPVFVASFGVSGFAIGLQAAQANALVARLPRMLTKMSLLHAFYGLGATVSPLVSTQFSKTSRWYHHYFVSLGLSVANVAFLWAVIRLRDETSLLGPQADDALVVAEEGSEKSSSSSARKMWDILKSKVVAMFALFALFYGGLAVTLGGWMPTYLILIRSGPPNSGYISTGFYGGFTLGRLLLIPLTSFLGPTHALYLYTLLALALEFIVWFVPDLVASAVAVSVMGLWLGPMYPVLMGVVARMLPRELQSGAIGLVACFGAGGSAVFPFLTGLLAERYGVKTMPPFVVAMLVALLGLWSLTPKVSKKERE